MSDLASTGSAGITRQHSTSSRRAINANQDAGARIGCSGPCKKQSPEEREENINQLEKTLAELYCRIRKEREVVEVVLKQPSLQPSLKSSKDGSISFQDGFLLANPVMSTLFEEVQPMIYVFKDHLSEVRLNIFQMLSTLDKENTSETLDTLEEYMTETHEVEATTPAQFLAILRVIRDMRVWTTEQEDNWISYHFTRDQLVSAGFQISSDKTGLRDRGLAIRAWDCAMASQTRINTNALLYNYIVLEDALFKCGLFLRTADTRRALLLTIYS